MSALTHYKAPPLHLALTCLLVHSSTAIKGFTTHQQRTTPFACLYMRHGGSGEPALPMAKGVRPVREKEKRKSQGSTCPHSCIIAQEGGSS